MREKADTRISPHFVSLGMLITGRCYADHETLSAMDVLAACIADDEKEPPKCIDFLFRNRRVA